MAQSNAERQAAWRQRRDARASGEMVAVMVAEAVDEAIVALWSFFNRPSPSGEPWADVEDFDGLDDYRERMRHSGNLVYECRQFQAFSGFTADERAALRRVVEIADALVMKS